MIYLTHHNSSYEHGLLSTEELEKFLIVRGIKYRRKKFLNFQTFDFFITRDPIAILGITMTYRVEKMSGYGKRKDEIVKVLYRI